MSMLTLDKTMEGRPHCVKSTCIHCKKYLDSNENIKIGDYYVCLSCFKDSNYNKDFFDKLYYDSLKSDNSDLKSLYWIKCSKCQKIHEFETTGFCMLGLQDYNKIICDCQKK